MNSKELHSLTPNGNGQGKDNKTVFKKRYNKPDEVKELERIFHENKKKQYPNFPADCLVFTNFRDDNTNELTKCVMNYTRLKGYFIERINSTGRMINGKWIKGTGTNGTADLSAIIKGRAVKIEIKCKATKDRQSNEQKEYQRQVEQAGAVYLIIREFSEFYYWLNSL
jgi:hypothetical protein